MVDQLFPQFQGRGLKASDASQRMGRQNPVAFSAWIAQMHPLACLFDPVGLDPMAPFGCVDGFGHAGLHSMGVAPFQPQLQIEAIEKRAG